jgi:CheY-like chemotaxis protein
VRILHVEDSRAVAETVRNMLEIKGWAVDFCSDGMEAFRRMAGDTHYNLILLDNDLPGASGVELVRHARDFRHRRRTPIIMLSRSDVEREAKDAGADAFLRKPEDVLTIAVTIARLLATKRKD